VRVGGGGDGSSELGDLRPADAALGFRV